MRKGTPIPNSKVKIAPSLLAADLARLAEEVALVEKAGADLLHFDVMDGHFVPNLTFGFPVIEALRKVTKLPIDAHLMISNADQYLDRFAQSGCNWISVHVEACPDIRKTLRHIRKLELKAGVALNPETPLASIETAVPEADFVLVMSVKPGFGGQKFDPVAWDKVREIKRRWPRLVVEIDGGIKETNATEAIEAGCDVLVVGTGLFGTKDYKATMKKLRGIN